MDKSTKIVLSFFVVAMLVLVGVFAVFVFYDSSEKKAEDKNDEVKKEKGYVYDVCWSTKTVKIGYDELKNNMTRCRFFSDGNILNGLIDGTLQFSCDFEFDERFLKSVNVSVSWMDRFKGLFGFMGDSLDISVCSPVGEKRGSIRSVPLRSKILYEKILKKGDPNVFISSFSLNECPPEDQVIAESSDEVLDLFWEEYDVLSYSTGYDSDWSIHGEVYSREVRFIPKVRNFFRNFFVSLISDPLDVEITYTYYVANFERVDDVVL